MTRNGSFLPEDSSDAAPSTATPETAEGEDIGCRAADLSADRYVESEHEHRTSRFARAVTRAQES